MSGTSRSAVRSSDDIGQADPLTRAAIARVEDERSYIRALVALCSSRLFMPVMAAEGDQPNEMSAVKLVDNEGELLLAFTGIDSMELWRKGARPVPCTLDDLCATAQEAGAERVLIDVAGPRSIVIAGEALALFAQGYAMAEFEGGEFAWVKQVQEAQDQRSGVA